MRLGGGPRRFSLEVRFDQTPIEGRLYAADGNFLRPFSGWLGLMAALDAASAETRPCAGEADGLRHRQTQTQG